MLFHKKDMIMIVCVMLVLLTGCSGERVSLEAALSEQGSDTQEVSAAYLEETQADVYVYVYVCGEVFKPGVYALEAGSRIAAAVEAAGGFTECASKEAVNLARQVEDGMQITIPSIQQALEEKQEQEKAALGLVNLNTATAEQLCSLSGIGQAKAESILAYRTEIGSFQSVEQLKEVTGIGESLFLKIKDNVYIE